MGHLPPFERMRVNFKIQTKEASLKQQSIAKKQCLLQLIHKPNQSNKTNQIFVSFKVKQKFK